VRRAVVAVRGALRALPAVAVRGAVVALRAVAVGGALGARIAVAVGRLLAGSPVGTLVVAGRAAGGGTIAGARGTLVGVPALLGYRGIGVESTVPLAARTGLRAVAVGRLVGLLVGVAADGRGL